MSELRRSVSEALGVLEPIYSESRFGLRLEELWQILDGLPAMETDTVKMVSRARSEVCIMAERFSWYNKVKEELKHLDLLVVQDIFLSETAELAHVLLPGVPAVLRQAPVAQHHVRGADARDGDRGVMVPIVSEVACVGPAPRVMTLTSP
jgi:hypothetical protein